MIRIHQDIDDGLGKVAGLAARIGDSQGAHAAREMKQRLVSELRARARNLTPDGRRNARRLASLKDIHGGERCVILGNGPSLNETDLGLLEHEYTFGLNRIYLMFERLGFATTFHVVINALVVEQCADEIRALRVPSFTTFANHDALARDRRITYINSLARPHFSDDLVRGAWEGATVTFMAMQLAYWMGFRHVILIGVDHNFQSTGPAHQTVESTGDDPNHFDPHYFGKGFRWQLPDLQTSEVAYQLARRAFERDGRRITDATVGGKLRIFERSSLEAELAKPRHSHP